MELIDRAFPEILKEFNMRGYAAAYEKLPSGTERLKLRNGVWTYVDEYRGSNPYEGRMLISKEGLPYWLMNYCGRCRSSDFTSKELYAELREALSHPDPEFPVRGRTSFKTTAGFEYGMAWRGNFFLFAGEEWLAFAGQKHYSGFFQGLKL